MTSQKKQVSHLPDTTVRRASCSSCSRTSPAITSVCRVCLFVFLVVCVSVISPAFVNSLSLQEMCEKFVMDQFCGCDLTTPPLTSQLLGRKHELAEIIQTLSRMGGQRTPVIQTAAPMGTGKSALLQELARIFINGNAASFLASSTAAPTHPPASAPVMPPALMMSTSAAPKSFPAGSRASAPAMSAASAKSTLQSLTPLKRAAGAPDASQSTSDSNELQVSCCDFLISYSNN